MKGLYADPIDEPNERMAVDEPSPPAHDAMREVQAASRPPVASSGSAAGSTGRRSPTANPPMRPTRRPTPMPRFSRFTTTATPANTKASSSRRPSVAPASVSLRLVVRPTKDDDDVIFDNANSSPPPAPPPGPQRAGTISCARPPAFIATRRPRTGWRDIAQRNFTSRNEGQCPRQAAAWAADPRNAILLHLPGHGAQDPGTEDRIAHAQGVFRDRLGVNLDNVDFIPAIPAAAGSRGSNTAPYYIAVFGLPEDVIDHIVAEGWVSTPEGTFRAEPMHAPPPRFQGVFMHPRRFGSVTEAGIEARIRRTIQDGGRNEEEVRTYIANDIADDGRWSHVDEDTVFNHLVRSIHVHVIPYQVRGGASEPLALVYIESPTADSNEWEAFRAFIMNLVYGDDLTGHPTPFTGTMWCSICHSHDHPTGLCDLPAVPGWNGPTQDYFTLKGSAVRRQERRPAGKDHQGKRHDEDKDDRRDGQDKRRRDYDGKGKRGGGASGSSTRRFT